MSGRGCVTPAACGTTRRQLAGRVSVLVGRRIAGVINATRTAAVAPRAAAVAPGSDPLKPPVGPLGPASWYAHPVDTPATAQGRKTRDRLVEAAAELIAKRGADGTSLDDVRSAT